MSDAPPKRKANWLAQRKAPADAPDPPAGHVARGRPKGVYEYHDQDGDLIGYMYDFITSGGEAIQLPVAWCEDVSGGLDDKRAGAWRWKWFPALRPLWNVGALLETPENSGLESVPVALLPDEYSAEVVQGLLPHFVSTTWPGGIKHIDETDWSPLRRRKVHVWLPAGAERYKVNGADPIAGLIKPLRQQKWFCACIDLAETLRRLDATVQFVLFKPGAHPDGFCLREARAAGWDAERIESTLRFETQFLTAGAADFIAGEVEGTASEPARPEPAIAADPGNDAWVKQLLRDRENDSILPELANVRLVLSEHPAWKPVIALDAFSHRIMKRALPPLAGARLGEWTDEDDIDAHIWLTSTSGILRVKTPDVTKAVLSIAALKAYNPLVDFLEQCEQLWRKDKRPRLDTWLQTYCGAGPQLTGEETMAMLERTDRLTRYLRLVGATYLLGAVKRAYHPGCQFDYMLILEGEQGMGKSSIFSILAGEWGMDSPVDFNHKDGAEAMQGKWIVEIPELGSFSKADNESAKGFFPRRVDRFRLAYAKRAKDFPRSNVFGGTTNEGEFFKDQTGNRRYWPVTVPRTDREALIRDRPLLLGEAVVRMKANEPVYPTLEQERELIRPEQERRLLADPWFVPLAEWLQGRDEVRLHEVLVDCMKIEIGKLDDSRMAARVGRAMHKLGWYKHDNGSADPRKRFAYRKVGNTNV